MTLKHCAECTTATYPEAEMCPHCGHDLFDQEVIDVAKISAIAGATDASTSVDVEGDPTDPHVNDVRGTADPEPERAAETDVEQAEDETPSDGYDDQTAEDLRAELGRRKDGEGRPLSRQGKREELIARLRENDAADAARQGQDNPFL